MRVYLIGYMGSGKTTTSKRLASVLGLPCYDLDQLFEEQYKIDIPHFFERYDESLFRKLESQLLKDTLQLDQAIIATGGGTPCFYDNMQWMNEHGLTVYIQMQAESVFHRLKSSKRKRPLVAQKTDEELNEFIREHMRQRNIFYSQAHVIVKGESLDVKGLTEKIIQTQKKLQK